jgi:hypothetical protein
VGVSVAVAVTEDVGGDDSPCHPRNGEVSSCISEIPKIDLFHNDSELAADVNNKLCTDFKFREGYPACYETISVIIGAPTKWNNHLRFLRLTVRREAYNNDCPQEGCQRSRVQDELDSVIIERWIPVLGQMEISGDVPKTITVSSGENLIFGVLHE